MIHTGFEPVTSSLSRRRSKPTELMNHCYVFGQASTTALCFNRRADNLDHRRLSKKASFVIHTGFEPVTSSLSRRRSKPTELMNHFMSSVLHLRLRYAVNRRTDNLDHRRPSKKSLFRDPDATRTHDRLLRRQMLYPAELPDQPLNWEIFDFRLQS